MQKLRKLQPLTKKQVAFMEEVATGLTPFEAAKKIYNCKNDSVARVLASRNSKHPVIYQTVRQLMESEGSKAKAHDILKAIEDGLVAERLFITKTGKTASVPHHIVRLKAAELALKVRGELRQDLPDIEVNKQITVNFKLVKARSSEDVKQLMGEDLYRRRPVLSG